MVTTKKTQTRKSSKRDLTAAHKRALAEGRRQGHVVRRYMEALESNKPKRGRKMSVERIQERLEEISEEMEQAGPSIRVQLAQERINLLAKMEAKTTSTDLSEAEQEFVECAKEYSERKGISYAAWREAGVPASVLKEAGIGRTRTKKS